MAAAGRFPLRSNQREFSGKNVAEAGKSGADARGIIVRIMISPAKS